MTDVMFLLFCNKIHKLSIFIGGKFLLAYLFYCSIIFQNLWLIWKGLRIVRFLVVITDLSSQSATATHSSRCTLWQKFAVVITQRIAALLCSVQRKTD